MTDENSINHLNVGIRSRLGNTKISDKRVLPTIHSIIAFWKSCAEVQNARSRFSRAGAVTRFEEIRKPASQGESGFLEELRHTVSDILTLEEKALGSRSR